MYRTRATGERVGGEKSKRCRRRELDKEGVRTEKRCRILTMLVLLSGEFKRWVHN